MAQIFNVPKTIKVPSLDFDKIDSYHKECDEFKATLKTALQRLNPNGKNVGEVIRFNVADGYAEYMVLSMKPVKLVHLPLMDAWEFQYAHLLTAKEVQECIDREKAMAKLFGR